MKKDFINMFDHDFIEVPENKLSELTANLEEVGDIIFTEDERSISLTHKWYKGVSVMLKFSSKDCADTFVKEVYIRRGAKWTI